VVDEQKIVLLMNRMNGMPLRAGSDTYLYREELRTFQAPGRADSVHHKHVGIPIINN
jgi:hypothetical protein